MGCKSSASEKDNEKKLLLKSQNLNKNHKKVKNHISHLNFKIVLLGGASVGKTSLVSSYCLGTNKQKYGPTVGGVYFKKEGITKNGEKITINIWDTAGE